MDAASMAQELAVYLTPLMPYLMQYGETVAKGAAERLGKATLRTGEALWTRLRGRVQSSPEADAAARRLGADPEDAEAQAAFRQELTKLLEDDPKLLESLAPVVKQLSHGQTPATHVENRVVQSGDRGISIGGDTGSVTVHHHKGSNDD